jgi:hypothetical protein
VNYNSLEQCKHKEKKYMQEVKRNRRGDEEATTTLKA